MTRTHDLLITNQLLYRLSYISIFTFRVADLILTNQLLYRLSYISLSIHDMVFWEGHIQNMIYFIIFLTDVNRFF